VVRRVEAVRDLSLVCADGELLALLGPSGCGKTSTLKMLAGIEDVSEGDTYFDDRPVTALDAAQRNVAMVFEDYALPVAVPKLITSQGVKWGELSVVGIAALVAILAAVFVLQRHIVRGLTMGAVKG
jgi:ABC-type taurine transport system ATPase subunit